MEKNTNTELDDISVQRNYKDTVFRMIFKESSRLDYVNTHIACKACSVMNIRQMDYHASMNPLGSLLTQKGVTGTV